MLYKKLHIINSRRRLNYLERIAVNENGRIHFLNAENIDWIASQVNYVKLHSVGETVDGFEAKLNPREFLRVRRSAIVRVDQIKELRLLFNGVYEIVLKSGVKISLSRRYRKNLGDLIKT